MPCMLTTVCSVERDMLKTLEKYSKNILQSITEGIVAFGSDRTVLAANRCFLEMLEKTKKGVLGQCYATVFEGVPDLINVLHDAFKKALFSEDRDIGYPLHNGTSRLLRVTTSPLKDEEDSVLGIVMILKDISVLKSAQHSMLQIEKMNALGRLAVSIAHEIRNPLSAINIQLQLLEEDLEQEGPSLREKIYDRTGIAQVEMRRLDNILNNFLRFSRPPQLKLSCVNLNDTVGYVITLVTPEANEREIKLEAQLEKGLPNIEGDEDQLSQALLNIVINSFQAIDGKGHISIKTKSASGEILLEVSDDGCGLHQKELPNIFEFYYTTKDEGTGLGLSIAQRAIHQHQGTIAVKSRHGSGTTVVIAIPVRS